MFYEMRYDMDNIDELHSLGRQYIYAEKNNFEELRKQFDSDFRYLLVKQNLSITWPNVEFYYSSMASDLESDYLLNASRWPIVHKRVKDVLEKERIQGISFFPIILIDVETNKRNQNYYAMYVTNFIDAYDMNKSTYKYFMKHNAYVFLPKQTYLKQEVCEKYDIFRCLKNVSCIYVSEHFYSIIVANKFSGFTFNVMPDC